MKFEILKQHKCLISKSKVIDAVKNPQKILDGQKSRKIAQKDLDDTHLLRVIYEEESGCKIIVTFYPGRKKFYET
ncbi:MAG: DUF4258 domain-containing protein [Elusimicrobia bacterium]|nr:DUF4258 domain-containing protein [Elusimicrobiota bacterium]